MPRSCKHYTCTQCGTQLTQRRQYAMCRPCYTAYAAAEVDEQVFAAIVAFKRANDGLSPRQRDIAQTIYLDAKTVASSLTRLEKAGRIHRRQHGKYRIDYVVVGGKWTYQEPAQ